MNREMLSAVAREKILRGFSFSCCLKSIGQLDAAAWRLEATPPDKGLANVSYSDHVRRCVRVVVPWPAR
jgi:hypothetical protein